MFKNIKLAKKHKAISDVVVTLMIMLVGLVAGFAIIVPGIFDGTGVAHDANQSKNNTIGILTQKDPTNVPDLSNPVSRPNYSDDALAETRSVTYNANGGQFSTGGTSNSMVYKKDVNGKYVLQFGTYLEPIKENGVFVGWYKDAACTPGKEYTVEETLSESIVVYAKWHQIDKFAVYSATDKTLTFYHSYLPSVGDLFNGREVTEIYRGFENDTYTLSSGKPNTPWYSRAEQIKKVEFFTALNPENTAYWFYGFTNCEEIDITNLDTEGVETMAGMFGQTGLNVTALKILGLEALDTSSVTNMSGMFADCGLTPVNYVIDSLKVSRVSAHNRVYNSWDTSKVTNMSEMFLNLGKGKGEFTLDLSGWNNRKVNTMNNMFKGANTLAKIIVSADFQFKGAEGKLPTPNSSYIQGAEGLWFNESTAAAYTPASIPSYVSATYIAVDPAFEITFNSNGGLFDDGQTTNVVRFYNGGPVSGTVELPTRRGMTFNGWYYSENASVGSEFNANAITEDSVVYAKWTYTTYTINYVTNGGTLPSGAKNSYTVNMATYTLPTPTKAGYTFAGWYTNSSFTGSAVTQIATNSTGNKVFYAKWTDVSGPTITMTLPAGLSSATPSSPIYTNKSNVNIGGVVSDNNGLNGLTLTTAGKDTAFDASGNFTASVQLNNGYNAIPVVAKDASGNTTTFNAHIFYDGQHPVITADAPSITREPVVTIDGAVVDETLKTVTVNGKPVSVDTNGNFSIDVTLTEGNNVVTIVATDKAGNVSELDLQIIYTAEYNITYNAAPGVFANGDTTNIVTYLHGNVISGTVIQPTRDGYTFAGWYIDEECTTPFNISTAPEKDAQVYAKWDKGMHAFAIYSADDQSLRFYYNDDELSGLTQYNGKTITTLYDNIELNGYQSAGLVPWYSDGKIYQTKLAVFENTNIPLSKIDYFFNGAGQLTTVSVAGRAIGSVVDIPDSVTTIGKYAFNECQALAGSLIIPSQITEIDVSAFARCTSFTGDLVIPNGVKTVGNQAFLGTGFAGSLVLSNSLESIGYAAFGESYFTGELILPSSLKTIGGSAFCNANFSGDLTIPNSVTMLESAAFSGCSNLKGTLTLGTGLTALYANTFDGTAFSKVVAPATITNYNNNSFPPSTTGRWFDISNGSAYDRNNIPTSYAATYITTNNRVKVTLNANNGVFSTGATLALEYFNGNLKEGTYEEPTRVNYEFNGWNTKPDGTGTKMEPSALTTAGTLYAQWKAVSYRIEYALEGGSIVNAPGLYTVETETFTIPTPYRTGYTFLGWTGSNGDTPATTVTIEKGHSGDLSFVANWQINSYQLTIDPNGGKRQEDGYSNVITANKEYAEETIIPVYVRDGYVLKGYTIKNSTTGSTATADLGGATLTFTGPHDTVRFVQGTEPITITANWEAINYTVTIDPNGGYKVADDSTTPSTHTIIYGQTLNIPEYRKAGFVLSGYELTNTATGNSTVTELGGASVIFNASSKSGTFTQGTTNVTVKMLWGANPYTYNIECLSSTGKYLGSSTVTKEYGTTNTVSPTAIAGYTSPEAQEIVWDSTTAKTITFTYEPISYSVTYELNGGSVSSANVTTYTIESATANLNRPTKNGYTFIGWTGSNGATPELNVSIANGSTGNKTYTANWEANEYVVTYKANYTGGPSDVADNAVFNADYTYRTNSFVRAGYTFIGWNTKADGSGADYTAKAGQTEKYTSTTSLTLYAQWKADTFTINFNGGNGGSGTMDSISVDMGEAFTLPDSSFTKKGYTFVGWTTKTDNTDDGYGWAAGASEIWTTTNGVKGVNDNTLNLYARWAPNTYSIKYNANGGSGSMSNTSATYDKNATLSGNGFNRTGYTFTGWNTKADGSGTSYAEGAKVKNLTSVNGKTVNLYAQWEVVNYTIKYELNGGSNPSGAPASYTITSAAITLPTPTRDGYTFIGWYTNAGFTGSPVTQIATGSTGNKTFYALWQSKGYTVKFNANGAEGTMSDQGFSVGETKALSANTFTKTGHVFTGWNTKADGSGTSYNNKANVTNLTSGGSTITLYAQWEAKTVEVTFSRNPGSGPIYTQTFTYGVSGNRFGYNTDGTPKWEQTGDFGGFEKIGYTLLGWSKSSTATTATWTPYNVVTDDWISKNSSSVRLYAVWQPNTYNVRFNSNGGNGTMSDQVLTYDAETNLTTNTFNKTGYSFIGWNTKADGSGTSYDDGASILNLTAEAGAVINLYAQWKANDYAYTFELESSSGKSLGSMKVTHTFGTVNNVQAIGVQGYELPDIMSVAWDSTSKTLKFIYEPIEYSISYVLNGGSFGNGEHPTSYTVETPAYTIPQPTRSGYAFEGWKYDDNQIEAFNMVIGGGRVGDLTLRALWGDATPPTITLTAPSNKGVVNNSIGNPHRTASGYVTITGYVDDAQEKDKLTVYAATDETQMNTVIDLASADKSSNGYYFEFEFPLVGGVNEICIRVYDSVGNNAWDYIYAVRDIYPPVITLDEYPYDASQLMEIGFTGTVTDDGGDGIYGGDDGVAKFTYHVDLSQPGTEYNPTDFHIFEDLTGVYGEQTRWLRAEDYFGNVATKEIKFIRNVNYKVTYLAGDGQFTDGSKTNVVSYSNGVVASGTEKIPEKAGSTFKRWNIDGKMWNGIHGYATDIEVTAMYEGNEYAITYDIDCGCGVQTGYALPTKYAYGQGKTISPSMTCNSGLHTFTGWTGSNGVTPQTRVTISTTDTGDKHYVANWKVTQYTYTVKYLSESDKELGSEKITKDFGTVLTLTAPDFEGYTTPAAQEITWDSKDKTIEFIYELIDYQINYDLGGGKIPGNNDSSTAVATNALNWNGDVNGLESFSGVLFKVSNAAPTVEELANGWSAVANVTEYDANANIYDIGFNAISLNSQTTGVNFTHEDGLSMLYFSDMPAILIVHQDLPDIALTKGTYLLNMSVEGSVFGNAEVVTSDVFVTMFTVNGFNGYDTDDYSEITWDGIINFDTAILISAEDTYLTYYQKVSDEVPPIEFLQYNTEIFIETATVGFDGPHIGINVPVGVDSVQQLIENVYSFLDVMLFVYEDADIAGQKMEKGIYFIGEVDTSVDSARASAWLSGVRTANTDVFYGMNNTQQSAPRYISLNSKNDGLESPILYTEDDSGTAYLVKVSDLAPDYNTLSNGARVEFLSKNDADSEISTTVLDYGDYDFTLSDNGKYANHFLVFVVFAETSIDGNPDVILAPGTYFSYIEEADGGFLYPAKMEVKGFSYSNYELSNPTSYNIESSTITLINPEKEGYTFAGWTGSNGSEAQMAVTIETGSTGDKEFTANWQTNAYTLTLQDVSDVLLGRGITAENLGVVMYDSVFSTERVDDPTAKDGKVIKLTFRDNDNTMLRGFFLDSNHVGDLEEGKAYSFTMTIRGTAGKYMTFITHEQSGMWEGVELTGDWQKYEQTFVATSGNQANQNKALIFLTQSGWVEGETFEIKDFDLVALESEEKVERQVIYGQSIGELPTPTRPGYTFAGWYTEYDGRGTQVQDNDIYMTRSDSTIYAYWKVNTDTSYVVKHYKMNLDGSTYTLASTENKIGATDTYVAPSTKTYEGFTAPEPEWVQIRGDGKTLVEYYYTRNAHYLDVNHTLNGQDVGNSYSASIGTFDVFVDGYQTGWSQGDYWQEHYYGASYEVKNITAMQGYHYAGQASVTGTMPDSDKAVVLAWETNTYSVKYDANGGSGSMSNSSHTYNVSKQLRANTFTRTGYTFKGWSRTPNGTVEFADLLPVINLTTNHDEVVTLYAVWEAITYTITYDVDTIRAEIPDNPETYTIETETFTLNNPTRTGYQFAGWTGSNGDVPNTEVTIEKGSIGNREYTDNYTGNTYYVEYVYGNNTETYKSTHRYGEWQQLLPVQYEIKTGYRAAGWNTQADFNGKPYALEENVTNLTDVNGATVTLYLKTYENSYTIKFNANGGTGEVRDFRTTYTTTISLRANAFEYPGYIFTGWNTKADGTGTAYADKEKVKGLSAENDGVITLYAQWKPSTYTIKFNANGGSGTMANLGMTYGTAKNLTANAFTRSGYTFLGWSTSSSATNAEYVDKASVVDLVSDGSTVTLYAVWHVQDKVAVTNWVVNDYNSDAGETSETKTWDTTLYDYALVTIKNGRNYDTAGGSDWLCHNRTVINGKTYNAVAGTKTYEISLENVDKLTVQLISSAWGGGLSGAYPIECVSVELKRYDGATYIVTDLVDWSKWGSVWQNTAEYTGKTYGTTYASYVGVSMNDGESSSNTVSLINGHKYYLNMFGGDYGDSNQALRITFSAFNIDISPSDHNARTSISQISTFSGTTGNYTIAIRPGATGTNYTGLGTTLNQCDIIDLTATFGAGNEPSIEWCRENIYGITSKLVTYTP